MQPTPSPQVPDSGAAHVARATGAETPPNPGWSALRIGALLLCIAGGVLCSVLLGLSFGGSGSALGASLCKPSESVNCDFVLASRWSRVGPLPVAGLGLAYFAGLGVWFAFVGLPNHAGCRWHLVPTAASTLGILASAWFIFLMATRLPVWCTWCLSAHGVNALLFLFILLGWPRAIAVGPSLAYPSTARACGVLAGCGGLAIVVGAVIITAGAQIQTTRMQAEYLKIANNIDYIEWRWRRGEVKEIPIRKDDLSMGPSAAKNTIVAFIDFQCASCAGFHRYIPQLGTYLKDTRIVFRHYPMSRSCNRYVNEGFHYFACEAALAAEAARIADPARAIAFMEKTFAQSERLEARPYGGIAKSVGIDASKFSAALKDPLAAQRIQEDIELAHRLGVEGTPAIFLNGRQLPNWHLLTTDARPQVDLTATKTLWDRLLGS